ncbi:unnamed protein product [Kuraishia capsulata CBS 1993]|uniref:GOLD domain-containing protein n=1 Tax=Kuraishia capsulata CBS 1993 TaxID=1382522 RepID=W6MR30_9ASCO|nr:uncharacterized protein KUCA_T00003681001 [Kuraishia capsulata CBS 1993]CDK27702.1 unnamed protein product [Kuraishia capsulata CBS 1993]
MRIYFFAFLALTVWANTESLVFDRSTLRIIDTHDEIASHQLAITPQTSLDVAIDLSRDKYTIILNDIGEGKYFVKACWSGLDPIDISLDCTLTSQNETILTIATTQDFYHIGKGSASDSFKNAYIRVQLLRNDRFYGSLNSEFITIIAFLVSLILVAVPASQFIARLVG